MLLLLPSALLAWGSQHVACSLCTAGIQVALLPAYACFCLAFSSRFLSVLQYLVYVHLPADQSILHCCQAHYTYQHKVPNEGSFNVSPSVLAFLACCSLLFTVKADAAFGASSLGVLHQQLLISLHMCCSVQALLVLFVLLRTLCVGFAAAGSCLSCSCLLTAD